MLRLPNRLPPNKGKPEEVDFSHICFYICTYSYYVYIPVMWRLPNRLLLTKGKRGKWISFTFFCQYTYFWGILCMYVCSYICQSFSSFVLDIFSNKLKTFTLAEGDVWHGQQMWIMFVEPGWQIYSPIFFQPQHGRHSWMWVSQPSWLGLVFHTFQFSFAWCLSVYLIFYFLTKKI